MLVLTDKITHPPLGAWVWGNQGIAYQVTRRFERGGQYWLTLATDSGPVEMPLARVAGWAEVPPSPTAEATPPPPIEAPPKAFHPGDPIEVYFPDDDRWRAGFRYLEPHRDPEKCWLTDSQGIEHASRLEWVRRGNHRSSHNFPEEMGGAPEDGGRPFQLGDHVRYLGEGWLGSQMRQLLTRKTLVVKLIQHSPTEGIWVTCYVPNGLDQTVPASDLKHFY
jgi:hypothetical protein